MLPVRFVLNTGAAKTDKKKQITIPRFTNVAYNGTYYLKNEIVIPITEDTPSTLNVDAIMFEGDLKESELYVANGDEFETFVLMDSFIKQSSRFISDNFFLVYVD